MKIYLASSYRRRDEMRKARDKLRKLGHEITCRWLDTDFPLEAGGSSVAPPELRRKHAIEDYEDVVESDMVLSFTDGTRARGGRHVEFGIALALGKLTAVIGPCEHVFHHLPSVNVYDSLESFIALEGWDC